MKKNLALDSFDYYSKLTFIHPKPGLSAATNLLEAETKEHSNEIRVLLVEQNHDAIMKIQQWLMETPSPVTYALRTTRGIRRALEILNHEPFDIVIARIAANDEAALAPLEDIRGHHTAVPILLLTDEPDDHLGRLAVKRGAQDLLALRVLSADSFCRSLLFAVERQKVHRQLQMKHLLDVHFSYHDPLTQLPNRNLFLDRFSTALKLAHRNNKVVGLLYIGLDDPEPNPQLDLVLEETARRLSKSLRATDSVARLSGSEFVVCLYDISIVQNAKLIASKLQTQLNAPISLGDRDYRTSVSIGISIYPHDHLTAEELIYDADLAMMRARSRSKNQIEVHGLK